MKRQGSMLYSTLRRIAFFCRSDLRIATYLYLALGIIALSFPVIDVSNRTYVAPSGRESEFPPTEDAISDSAEYNIFFTSSIEVEISNPLRRLLSFAVAKVMFVSIVLTLDAMADAEARRVRVRGYQ